MGWVRGYHYELSYYKVPHVPVVLSRPRSSSDMRFIVLAFSTKSVVCYVLIYHSEYCIQVVRLSNLKFLLIYQSYIGKPSCSALWSPAEPREALRPRIR